MEIIEDRNICAKCGGMCCKKSGCDYWIEDVKDKSLNGLINFIASENVSIVAFMHFKELNGKIINAPFLYLRARNDDRDIVDLLSMKTKCSKLTDTGCEYSYEERPSGGKNLVPVENGRCHPNINPMDKILEWEPYQKQLTRIVKRYTGKTVDQKLREDVTNLFYDLRVGNIKGVSPIELEDIKGMLPLLARCYPEEAKKAQLIRNKVNEKK